MGADIYLRSVNDKARAEWEPKFKAAVAARDAKWPQGSVIPRDKYGRPDVPEQKAVDEAMDRMNGEGYFRDSYNRTSLFSFLGISWWASAGVTRPDGSPYQWSINGEGFMSVRSMTALRDFLRDRGEVTCDQMKAWRTALDDGADIPDEGENSLTEWGKMFERKRRRLIKLLEQAIALKEPLYCSV